MTQAQSSAPMKSSLETTLNALNEQLARSNDQRTQTQQTLTYINAKLDHTRPKYEEPYQVHPNPRRIPRQSPGFEPHPRRPNHDPVDQTFRDIRVEAPMFDGSLNPKVYIDWEVKMDQYFEWYDMTEQRKCKYAELRLVREARLFWRDVERTIRQRGDDPIVSWRAMKAKLRGMYLPPSYHQRLLDQWQR